MPLFVACRGVCERTQGPALPEAEGARLGVQIRHFAWADIEAIARLHRASEPLDRAGRICDAIALQERWRHPGSNPERDCLIAEAGGTVAGYTLRSLPQGTDQCLVDGVIHPAWRRRGIGRQLLRRTADEARQAGGRTLELRARDDEPGLVAFCEALGFRLARTWHRMWLEPLRIPSFAFPAGYSWRYFRPRQDEAPYAEIVNATFGEHWGMGPTTVERVAHMVSKPGFRYTDILFATCQREIVGVCSTRFFEREVGARRFSAAHIGPVGVQAAHRCQGLARAMLTACLRQCRRQRIQAAELDVDEGNAAAIHVYADCGFEDLFRIFWYRHELRGQSEG